jgi:hypothetical protein
MHRADLRHENDVRNCKSMHITLSILTPHFMLLDTIRTICIRVKDIMKPLLRNSRRIGASYAQVTAETAALQPAQETLSPELKRAMHRCKTLDAELIACKEELCKERDQHATLIVNESKANATLASIRSAKEAMDARCVALMKASEVFKKNFEELEKRAGEEVATLRETKKKVQRELEVALKAMEEAKRDLKHLRTANKNMRHLLDARTSELRDAQAYLSKTDSLAHADVQRMVENLNSQIFQLSALLTDSFTFVESRQQHVDFRASCDKVNQYLGPPTTALLLDTLHADDPIWVQVVLQAMGTMYAGSIIGAWNLRFSSAQNALLTDIHNLLFELGKWRCAAYTSMSPNSLILSDQSRRRCPRDGAFSLDSIARGLVPTLTWQQMQQKSFLKPSKLSCLFLEREFPSASRMGRAS